MVLIFYTKLLFTQQHKGFLNKLVDSVVTSSFFY